MDLIVDKQVMSINTAVVASGDFATFTRSGVKANGIITDVKETALKVKYYDLSSMAEVERSFNVAQLNDVDFRVFKTAKHSFADIRDGVEKIITLKAHKVINTQLPTGVAFFYALNGINYTMGVTAEVTETYIDLVLKDASRYRLGIAKILTDSFRCRFSANLLYTSCWPDTRPALLHVQRYVTNDDLNLLMRGSGAGV